MKRSSKCRACAHARSGSCSIASAGASRPLCRTNTPRVSSKHKRSSEPTSDSEDEREKAVKSIFVMLISLLLAVGVHASAAYDAATHEQIGLRAATTESSLDTVLREDLG